MEVNASSRGLPVTSPRGFVKEEEENSEALPPGQGFAGAPEPEGERYPAEAPISLCAGPAMTSRACCARWFLRITESTRFPQETHRQALRLMLSSSRS